MRKKFSLAPHSRRDYYCVFLVEENCLNSWLDISKLVFCKNIRMFLIGKHFLYLPSIEIEGITYI